MSLRIQSECEKLWTRTTPNTNTFHAVHITEKDWRLLFEFFCFLFLFIEFIISNFLLNLANFICYLSFCLRDVVYFSYIFAWLLQQMEVTLAKSLLLCKSSGKSTSRCKFLVSNGEAILTYWFSKNMFFTFFKLDCAIFKSLKC